MIGHLFGFEYYFIPSLYVASQQRKKMVQFKNNKTMKPKKHFFLAMLAACFISACSLANPAPSVSAAGTEAPHRKIYAYFQSNQDFGVGEYGIDRKSVV